ncbi:hypothetical protein E0L36_23095 [Streptomyces sp. AJS327]|uniref:hypothetical protein n=1 Tax=Streptomyces sp. AJS327 TaxID=2545265 RepID=UPI0015E02F45|nr:hypothetical protein [Streptomyces sp. AJS327]MBA0053646.1 hypothetical protein [Streptomyces sp. AJS327]
MTMTLTTACDALATARRYCDQRCFAYHASWRFFRRTGLKGNPTWHTGFYRTALTNWSPSTGRLRVLIAGAADETVLVTLERLVNRHRHRLEVHLIDTCPTPLHLARAHAHWSGLHLTERLDRAPQLATCVPPFDLILTDGLLSLLPTPGQRAETITRLVQLLADQGMLLYTTRVAGDAGVLEYDRLGRRITAATALLTWPGPPHQRLRMARSLRERPSRPAPFTTAEEITSSFASHFAHVRTYTRKAPHSLPLALAPSVRAGVGSTSVGVAATHGSAP